MTARSRVMRRWLTKPSTFAIALVVLLFVGNLIVSPSFVGSKELPFTLGTLAPFVIAGMASTPAFLTGGGGIDLSIAPTMGLVNILLVTKLLGTVFGGPLLAVPILIVIGAAVGSLNGLLVARLRYPPVIATLGMYFVLSGLDLALVPLPVTRSTGWINALGRSTGPIPGAIITIGVPLLIWAFLRRTAFVETLLSVGDNDATAFSAGVNVVRVRVAAYALGGAIAAIGGIALTSLIHSADATAFNNYMLVALAAVALGGTRLSGGRGGIGLSAIGAVGIFLITNLLAGLNVSSDLSQVAYGAVLIVALALGGFVNRRPTDAI